MTTVTATQARKEFFDLLKSTKDRHEIVKIRYREGDAVLMSQDEYDSLQETLFLLSSPGFKEGFDKSRQEAENGNTVSFEDVFANEA